MSKGLDDKDAQVIVDWLNSNGKDSNYELTAKDLQEIFKNNPDRLNEVAETLGVELTESDAEPDDEKKKEIQKWVTKLASLKDAEFDKLDEVLKEKVAQMFINDEIAVDNDDVINEKLAGFIKEVKDEKKQNEISITIEKGGKAVITKVSDNTTLEEKKSTKRDDESFFAKVDDVWEAYFNYGVKRLTRLEDLERKVSGWSLKIAGGKLYVNEIEHTEDYFKNVAFWTVVRVYADLFGITEKSKFEIEKTGSDDEAIVKINGFETKLQWNDVVESENTFKADSGWDKIFKLKSEEPKPVETKTEVTIEWNATSGYKLNDATDFTKIDTLESLQDLVIELKYKTVKEFKGDFTLTFSEGNVRVCGGEGIDISKEDSLIWFLKNVVILKDRFKVIDSAFKIKVGINEDDCIKFGDFVVDKGVMIKNEFWNVVWVGKNLFDGLPIQVVRDNALNSKKGKIGSTVIDVEMFNGETIAYTWNGIFKL